MISSVTQLPVQRDLVDSAWTEAEASGPALVDPNTGESLGNAVQSSESAVDAALAAAARVAELWARSSARLEFLEAYADALGQRAEAIAHTEAVDTGVPISVTTLFAEALPDVVRRAADLARECDDDVDLTVDGRPLHLLRRPWGPAAVIAPFNAPAFTVVKKSAYALAAGCPVIAKPSPVAAHAADLVAEAALAAAVASAVPPTVVQLVHGDGRVGARLARSPAIRCITFTGSRAAGTAIVAAASGHLPALQLECGSNNPAIVRADADLDHTARQLVTGFTKLNGQWCERPGTVLVPAPMLAALQEALLDRIAHLCIGGSLDPASEFGPQANPAQRDAVLAAIDRLRQHGGVVHCGADVPAHGCYVAPTLVTNASPEATVEEIFGPVLVLHPVADDAEAIQLANTRAGGLAGYVFSRDTAAAAAIGAELHAGEVKINGTSVLDMHPDSAQSFWYGSGLGGHGDRALLRFFTGERIVGVDLPDAAL